MKFEEMKLKEELLKAVHKAGFTEATSIQEKCIPAALEGRDVVGQSATGSGKTAAYGLPILQNIEKGKGVQALILAPTRELAQQVKDRMDEFARFLGIHIAIVYGGVGMQPQIDALARAEIVVATPGRMLDHLGRGTANLRKVKILVLDEADKMFEMGFIEDVEEIMKSLSKERQTLLFSATIADRVHHLIKKYLKTPYLIKEKIHVDRSLLKQVYYNVRPNDKFALLLHLLKHKTEGLAIVFCGTRREVDMVSRNLKINGIKALAVHGGLSQNMRTNAVDALRAENISVLVATDVAARGLDIQNISHVYNYDSPKNSEEYTHRIGRTARMGNKGDAVTLLCDRDHDNFRNVMSDRNLRIDNEEPPAFEKIPFQRVEERRDNPRFGRGNAQRGGQGRRNSYEETQGTHHERSSRPSSGRPAQSSSEHSSGTRSSGPRRFGSGNGGNRRFAGGNRGRR
ncbi:MAG: DEAD/DEAH box helicase [Candidatus Nanoarchaeia archaeon]